MSVWLVFKRAKKNVSKGKKKRKRKIRYAFEM